MNPTLKKLAILLVACLCPVLLTGCITYETFECRITRATKDGTPNRHVMEYGNLTTDMELEFVESEFEELLDNVNGDQMLLAFMDNDLYIKDRQILFKDGKLYGRMTAISSMLEYGEQLEHDKDGYWVEYDFKDGLPEVLETNGNVVKEEKKLRITWPGGTNEFHWKIREHSFDPKNEASRIRFAKIARAYLHPVNRLIRWLTQGHHPGFFVFSKAKDAK